MLFVGLTAVRVPPPHASVARHDSPPARKHFRLNVIIPSPRREGSSLCRSKIRFETGHAGTFQTSATRHGLRSDRAGHAGRADVGLERRVPDVACEWSPATFVCGFGGALQKHLAIPRRPSRSDRCAAPHTVRPVVTLRKRPRDRRRKDESTELPMSEAVGQSAILTALSNAAARVYYQK